MELTNKNLSWTKGINLRGADLSRYDLRDAKLNSTILSSADLSYADLSRANLRWANLRGANLIRANLFKADLYGADLYGADLYDATLIQTILTEANLSEAKNIPFVPLACPDTGSFIGYKKALDYAHNEHYIVKLQILDDSKRSSATTSKCRCDKAKVLAIENIDGSVAEVSRVNSWHDFNFRYEVGKIVQVDNYDENRWNECSGGIHFFVNRKEAVNYAI